MLDSLLVGEVFAFMMCFVRLSVFLSQVPALGEQIISVRVRLYMALLLSLILAPIVEQYIPPRPENNLALTLLIAHEIVIGLFMGLCFKVLMSILQIAGTVISFLIGLSTLQSIAPALGVPGSPHSVILTMGATCIIFITGVHLQFLEIFIVSYQMMPADAPIMWKDMATKMIDIVNLIFVVGVQIAGVFFVIIIPANLFVGVVSRFMPAIQAFLVLLPGQLLIGIWLFALTVPASIHVFGLHLEELILFFLGKG